MPVAWMISNKEDDNTLCEFLEAILKRTGGIEMKYFMSDDAPVLFIMDDLVDSLKYWSRESSHGFLTYHS